MPRGKTSIKRLMGSLARVDLTALDAEIAAAEGEIERLRAMRALIVNARTLAGNGTIPAQGGPTKREQIVNFLKSRRAPVTAAEIAQALGIERGTVQSSLYKMQEMKLVRKAKEGGWESA